jgi:hypothetical protein
LRQRKKKNEIENAFFYDFTRPMIIWFFKTSKFKAGIGRQVTSSGGRHQKSEG